MKRVRRDRGVTTVEWVIVAMIIGVGCIAVFRTFKDRYMQPATERMGDCIEAAAGDGNLCGGLATGGASSGGGSANGGSGALAQNGPGTGGNGMSAGDLVRAAGGGERPGGERPGENPNATIANRIGYGMGLAQAGEDALIDAARRAAGAEGIPGLADHLFDVARAGEGAVVAVPLDIIANGVPRTAADGASLAAKTAIVGAAGWFGGPVGAVAAVGLDKSIGYLSDSMTGGNRYASDYEDAIAWRMVHGQAGTIGRDGLAAQQANEQRMIHEQLDYMRQQRERDAEALREMMPH